MTGRVYVNLLEGFLLPVTFCDIRKNHGHWTDNGKPIEKTHGKTHVSWLFKLPSGNLTVCY